MTCTESKLHDSAKDVEIEKLKEKLDYYESGQDRKNLLDKIQSLESGEEYTRLKDENTRLKNEKRRLKNEKRRLVDEMIELQKKLLDKQTNVKNVNVNNYGDNNYGYNLRQDRSYAP